VFPLGPHHTSPPKFKVSSCRSTTWILNQRSHFSHTTKLKGRNKSGNTDLVQETKKISTYNIALIESKLYSNSNETGNQKDKRKQTRTHGKMLLVAHFLRMEPNTLVHLLYVNKWQEEGVLQWRKPWKTTCIYSVEKEYNKWICISFTSKNFICSVNASNILETEIRERQSIHEKERVKKTRKRKEEKKKQEIFLRAERIKAERVTFIHSWTAQVGEREVFGITENREESNACGQRLKK